MNTLSLTILIVEDHKMMGELIKRWLEPIREKFPLGETILVSTREESIKVLAEYKVPDAAVIDLKLPDSDVDTTIGMIETYFKDKVAVIVLTGMSATDTLLEKVKQTQSEFITKDEANDNPRKFVFRFVIAMIRHSRHGKRMDVVDEKLKAFDELKTQYAALQ